MKTLLGLLGLIVLLNFAPSANGDGFIVVDEAHWGPWPRPPQPLPPAWVPPPRFYRFAPLEVLNHHVSVKIDDQVATTTVDQEFYNPNSQRLEGTYMFPIPKGAQIDKFTMDIGGKTVEAELLPADKARKIYEDIVRKARDPALMEYADRDLLKVRVFPIEPNSRKRISLSYTQVLKSDAGLVGYVYPLNTEKFSARPIKEVSVKVQLASKHPLKAIYSPSHAAQIKRDGPNRATVTYEAADAQPDADFALYFAPEPDELGLNLLAYRNLPREDGYFLLLLSPGLETKNQAIQPKDVALVLDTSGSMAGKKLDQAKKALLFCVESLNDQDRFEILRFSTEVEPLFDKLVDATRSNRDQARQFIKDLKATGATAIDDVLKKALNLRNAQSERNRPLIVIFLTDGMPTIGETDENLILAHVKEESQGRTRVFCFGIGGDVNTHLLDKIAEETRAVSQYVLPEEDLELKVSSFFEKIKEPVLANPTLTFTGQLRTSKLHPSPLPDLFRGDQLALVGRYSGHGESAVILEGSVNGTTRKFTYEVKFPEQSDQHEFIPRLWAVRRVGFLLDEIRLRGETSELRDEATELARQYGIVTPYTAYMIVEDERRRGVPITVQSLPQLGADRLALGDAEGNWKDYKTLDTGDKALAGSRFSQALRLADAPAAAVASGSFEANRALGGAGHFSGGGGGGGGSVSAAEASKARLAQYSNDERFAGGKNFFLNGTQWVDSAVQEFQSAARARIQFNSPEYFALAAREPRVLPWLALGQNVQFVLDKTIYDVHE